MVSHHLSKFGGHKHCCSGDMFLVVQEQDSTYSRLIPPSLFIPKARGLKTYGLLHRSKNNFLT